MADIRLDCSFMNHPKRRKLQRRGGADAVLAFIDLLLWVAQDMARSVNGDLSGMDAEDIAIAGQWLADPTEFLSMLIEVKLVDGVPGAYSVHNWSKRQAWLAGAAQRSEKARKAAEERWGNRCSEHATSNATGDARSNAEFETSNAPDPTRPDPTKPNLFAPPQAPVPPVEDKKKKPAQGGVTPADVVALWQERHKGQLRGGGDDKLKAKIRKRIANGYTLEDFRKAIDGMHLSPFHLGENDKGTKHLKLELIVRDQEHMDMFMGYVDDPPMNPQKRRAKEERDREYAEMLQGCADSPMEPPPRPCGPDEWPYGPPTKQESFL